MLKKYGKKRLLSNKYDQFYTKEDCSVMCLTNLKNFIDINNFDIVIEPSAGTGSFNKAFRNVFPNYQGKFISYDIDPKANDIIKQDYLKLDISDFKDKNVLVIGNPPFGQNSKLAKLFIKKSCEYANIIAFILSSSFKKNTMNNCFNLFFHKEQEFEIPEDAFIVDDKIHNVDCIFQIWKKKISKRKIKKKNYESTKFKYVKVKEEADFAFRRVGAKAGTASTNLNQSSQSNHFIKLNKPVDNVDNLIEKINSIDWGFGNKKGQYPSIPKIEINEKIEQFL